MVVSCGSMLFQRNRFQRNGIMLGSWLGDVIRRNIVVVDKLLYLIVEKLSPFCQLWARLGTKIYEKPNPSLEATDFVFRPALFPCEIQNP